MIKIDDMRACFWRPLSHLSHPPARSELARASKKKRAQEDRRQETGNRRLDRSMVKIPQKRAGIRQCRVTQPTFIIPSSFSPFLGWKSWFVKGNTTKTRISQKLQTYWQVILLEAMHMLEHNLILENTCIRGDSIDILKLYVVVKRN